MHLTQILRHVNSQLNEVQGRGVTVRGAHTDKARGLEWYKSMLRARVVKSSHIRTIPCDQFYDFVKGVVNGKGYW